MKKRQRRSIRLRGYDYTRAGAYFLTMCVQDRVCLFGDVDADALHLNDAGCMVERWWLELNNKFPGVETDAFVVMPNHIHGIIVLANDVTVPSDNGPRVPHGAGQTDNHTVDHDVIVPPDNGPRVPHGAGQTDNHTIDHDVIVRPDNGPRVPHGAGQIDNHTVDHDVIVGADLRVRPLRNDDNNDQYGANGRREYGAQQGGGHIGPPLRDHGTMVRGAGHDRGPTDRVAVGTVVQWFKTMATNEYIRGVKTLGWPPFDGRVWQRDYWERIVRDADELRRIRRYIANNPRRWWQDRNNPNGRVVAPFAGQRIVTD